MPTATEQVGQVADELRDFGAVDDFNEPEPQHEPEPQGQSSDEQIISGGKQAADAAEPRAGEGEGPAQSQPVESSPPEFDRDLLYSLGMTPEQAQSQFSSNDELAQHARSINAMLLHNARQQLQAQWQQAQQQMPQNVAPGAAMPQQMQQLPPQQLMQQPPQQPPAQAVPQQAEGQNPFQLPEFPLKDDDWEPEYVETFVQPMRNYLEQALGQVILPQLQHIQQMQQAVQMMAQVHLQEAQQRYNTEFEAALEGLDGDWQKLFGKGQFHELNPNSEEVRNRQTLDVHVKLLNQARQQHGLPPLPLRKALSEAVASAFPDHYRNNVHRQVTQHVDHRSRQWTARPSAKTPSGATPLERAAQAAEQFYQDKGIPTQMPVEQIDEI